MKRGASIPRLYVGWSSPRRPRTLSPMRPIRFALPLLVGLVACDRGGRRETDPVPPPSETPMPAANDPAKLSDAQWRAKLTPEQYHVLREKGTERPGTGEYWKTTTPGEYRCAGCGDVLFLSGSKFDSECGWPSFDKATANIVESKDSSYGWDRTEITCSRCGGHIGHVFDDGPTKTGLRYCVNSASVALKAKASEKDTKASDAGPAAASK